MKTETVQVPRELLACPFTGETPDVSLWYPSDGRRSGYANGVWIATIKSSAVTIERSSLDSELEALTRAYDSWNRRAQPASAEPVADALNWLDDFVARCNGDDRGSCGPLNILRASLAAPPAIPDGYAMVPVEPTNGMLSALLDPQERRGGDLAPWMQARMRYQRMLKAAPTKEKGN